MTSDFVAFEHFVVLLTPWALRAFEAAHQQDCHANRDENGEQVCVGYDPVEKAVHKLNRTTLLHSTSRGIGEVVYIDPGRNAHSLALRFDVGYAEFSCI